VGESFRDGESLVGVGFEEFLKEVDGCEREKGRRGQLDSEGEERETKRAERTRRVEGFPDGGAEVHLEEGKEGKQKSVDQSSSEHEDAWRRVGTHISRLNPFGESRDRDSLLLLRLRLHILLLVVVSVVLVVDELVLLLLLRLSVVVLVSERVASSESEEGRDSFEVSLKLE